MNRRRMKREMERLDKGGQESKEEVHKSDS